jgi:phosphoglycerate kinase
MMLRSISTAEDLKGKYVLLRSSLNIPLKDGKIRNRFRLEQALPTLRYLHEQGAKIIVVSHIGRKPEETLKPVYQELEKYLPMQWGGSFSSDECKERRKLMAPGDILVTENIRQDLREKENDASLVEELAALADVYVNDAFAAIHREHASVYGVAKKLPAYAGLTLVKEVHELRKAMSPRHPSIFLLGGAKFQTKLPLIEQYLELYDKVFIGGALANDIYKARGLEVGKSLVSDIDLSEASFLNDPDLIVPIDVVVDGPEGRQTKLPEDVLPEEKILDAGSQTIAMLSTYIENAKTILWNGPFGAYEMGYTESTEITARFVAGADGYSVVGGGDTVAAIEDLHLNELFSHLSIGGGSMLTFLEHGTTPALELLAGE